MLKELLLQFVVSLLPAVSYQLWHEFNIQKKKMHLFGCMISAISMLLCTFLCFDVQEYDLDFRVIPYLIGSLYGGPFSIYLLSALYVGNKLVMLNSIQEGIAVWLFTAISVPLLLKLVKPFQSADIRKKQWIGFWLSFSAMTYYVITMLLYEREAVLLWPGDIKMAFLLFFLITPVAMYLSILIIELLRRSKRLQEEVQLISMNYRNQVEKLQQFINETNFAVLLVDDKGNLTHINELGMKLFRLAPNDGSTNYFLGCNFHQIFQPAGEDLCVFLLNGALTGEKIALDPVMGEEKVYLKTAFPLYSADNDRIAGAALILQDVTEITRLRNEVDRMERLSLVGQMAASITHEIRNPMAVIRGFVQLLKERSPADQQHYFHIVMDELDRTNNIISDFLSLAQNRALSMEMGSLNVTIHKIAPLLEADANMRGQTLQLDLQEIPEIMMNEKEIKQLLLNLARNGMEAMEDKGVLHISTRHEQDSIVLSIRDEGTGIPQDKIKHLFEPFFTTKQRGTGLGLSLCLSIAERHRGRIDVSSKLGEGTTFVVSFDLATGHNELGSRAYYGTAASE